MTMKTIRQLTLASCVLGINVITAHAQAPVREAQDVKVQLVPLRKPVIASEIAGKVDRLGYRPGENFPTNAVLIAFNCDLHKLRESRANLQVEKARMQAEALQKLDKRGAASVLDIEIAKNELAMSEAERDAASLMVSRCIVRAPFAGSVVERRIAEGEYVNEGRELIEIVEDGRVEIEAIIPSRLLSSLKKGDVFEARFDELPRPVRFSIDRFSPVIDPVSQTIKMYGVVEGSSSDLLAGMSGRAKLRGEQ